MLKPVIYRVWQHQETGQRASIHGAVPYQSETKKKLWSVVEAGWTVFDTYNNTYGCGRYPFATEELAKEFCDKFNK